MKFTIHKVVEGEISVLADISRTTFIDAFGALNKKSDMNLYVNDHLNNEKIQSEWHHPDSAFYFLKEEERVVGYIKLNMGTAQNEDVNSGLEVERIYVIKDYQSRGCGKILFDFSIEQARKLGKSSMWLGVWEHNEGAIRFYQRQGLNVFGNHAFMLGEDLQNDVLMKIDL